MRVGTNSTDYGTRHHRHDLFHRTLPTQALMCDFAPLSIADYAQTCLDLLEHGYGVHVVCDGVSSQK